MILKNPINKDLEIMVEGIVYKLPANGTVSVSKEVGEYWFKNIHQFLEILPEEVKEVKEVKEEKEEVIKEEKPKKK